MYSNIIFLIIVSLFLVGASSSIALINLPKANRMVANSLAIAACALLFALSISCLAGIQSVKFILPINVESLTFHFEFTPFSSLFIALISGLGLVSSIHALSYAEEYDHRASLLGFFYNLFLLGMSLVPASQNVFSFLVTWEGMTLSSFFLVNLNHEKAESRKSGYIYLVMSQAGTAFIILLFLILYRQTGSWEFDSWKNIGPQLPMHLKNILFLLALIGFGTKAGIVPLHLWLPYAHPSAPSHVSCLMSGAMIKIGIYGLLLVTFTFLGGGSWWWGALVLVVAALSSVLGVLYALMEHEIKRLLAYHSVENIGIILMGLGVGMIFFTFGRTELSILALSAGLYHTMNHATFKGLLFLSAGSVIKSTHTRNIEEMGGLIKKMPITAFSFLVGSAAISALPPLNGFVSEWLTFQSLLSGFHLSSSMCRVLCLLVIAALALTGGLAAACFVKAFGITFLAMPRSDHAKNALEAPLPERIAMVILAVACLALGIFPHYVLNVIRISLGYLMPGFSSLPVKTTYEPMSTPFGDLAPIWLLIFLFAGFIAALLIGRILGGKPKLRYGSTWDCGIPSLMPRMEYTATAFSKPFRMLFSFIFRPVREVRQDFASSPYFPTSIHYTNEITPLIKEKLYRPPVQLLLKGSHLFRHFQGGSLNIYLGYMLVTLIVILTSFLF